MTGLTAPKVRRHRLQPPLLGDEDVERPRLTAAILATAPSGTCVVTAPPGYGATTAVAQAMSDAAGVAWIGFDAFDTTPSHWWTQLTASLTSGGEDTAGMPDVSGDHDVLTQISALVEWLERSSWAWIVLDGVDSQRHEAWLPALAYLIANLPRRIRLVITTHDAPRRMPADPADRRIMVVDREQLAATADEAARIAMASAPYLDIDTVEEIVAAARGWVAAIRSAARFAAHHPTENAGHWLLRQGASALLDPWLDRLPPERMAFLADTAFLTLLAGPLCDVALESSGSLAALQDLESRGSYLNSTPSTLADDTLRWWERHPLVTAALTQRTTTADDPDRNLRAAAWFEARGDFESTMRHLLAAGRLDEAGRYLSEHENTLFEEGQGDRAAAWYASLPPDSWGQLGWHHVRIAWGQAIGADPQSAEATLAQLRAHLATSPAEGVEQRVLQAEAATLTSYLASMAGDTSLAISGARSAFDLFCEESPDNSQQVAATMLIRALLWEGDYTGARRELNRVKFQPFPTALLREVSLCALRAQCLTDEGYIKQARREVRSAMKWLADHGLTPIDVSQFSLMTADGSTTLESGDAAGAVSILSASIDGALARASIGDAATALIWLARARACQGQLGDALACIHQARGLLHDSAPSSPILSRVDLTESFVRNMGGDTVRAERLVQRVPASDARTLMWARVTMHRQVSGVRRSLAAIDTDLPRIAIEKQVLLALVAMQRTHSLAEGHLTRAADLADANGYRLALLGCPTDLLDLASSLASRTSDDGLAQLVKFAKPLESQPLSEAVRAVASRSSGGPPLSAGEVELISYLPRRDSNAEIARQLGVSINTVKTRLYRMYRKLGVDNRDEAIEVARARGLIS